MLQPYARDYSKEILFWQCSFLSFIVETITLVLDRMPLIALVLRGAFGVLFCSATFSAFLSLLKLLSEARARFSLVNLLR